MRLARRGGGLGSGDLPLIWGRITFSAILKYVKRFSQSQGGHDEIAPQLAELVVQRGFNRSGLRLPGNEIRALQGARAKNLLCIRLNDTGVDASPIKDL